MQLRDVQILERVKDNLAEDARLLESNIEVSVAEGVVYLVGSVKSQIGREAAESNATHVKGVVTVDNRLRVEGRA